MSNSMTGPRLVFLGAAEVSRGLEPLRCEGEALAAGAGLPLVRKRSPWNPRWEAERVIVGSDPARADVLLEGIGIHPEHLRLYVSRSGGPIDLRSLEPQSTRLDGEPVKPLEWRRLRGGELIELGPWRFRFESESGAGAPDR